MNQCGRLTGRISLGMVLTGRISPGLVLSGTVAIPYVVPVHQYEGAYQVTPKVAENVVLPTNGKQMQQDVTVNKIPQFEVSNDAGGRTFIIGEEYFNG